MIKLVKGFEFKIKNTNYKIVQLLESEVFEVIDQKNRLSKMSIRKILENVKKNQVIKINPNEDPKKVKIAKERLKAVKELSNSKMNSEERKELAKKHNTSVNTLYRWKKLFEETEVLSSLYPQKKNGGKGKSRLSGEVDQIITKTINEVYLNSNKLNKMQLYRSILLECRKSKLAPPDYTTVCRRVQQLSDEKILKARFGKITSDQTYEIRDAEYNEAQGPLDVVQIDHTPLNIILVDSIDRKPLGRPWLTLAIDAYSRMVVGYYLSFDPPGATGTGLCISHSILTKEQTLDGLGIKGTWPCWGVMKCIHLDNAREFKGVMLHRACEEYQIEISWRALDKTFWGGIVERYFRTLKTEIQTLPGTTFDKPDKRVNYDSEKEAALTLQEFEKWMVEHIVNVYHQKINEGIGIAPIHKWEKGILGDSDAFGTGIPTIIDDSKKVKLDFLPGVERTIQRYGVKINKISYYSDILKVPMFNDLKRKYIFKLDPRDISKIYFWNDDLLEYIEIPYRNMSLPSISTWEYKKTINALRKANVELVDEEAIFRAYEELSALKDNAVQKTKKKRVSRNYKTLNNKSKVKEEGDNLDKLENIVLTPLNIEE